LRPFPCLAHPALFFFFFFFSSPCTPLTGYYSVVYYITPHLQHTTHAVRDIAAGEELTISYLNSFRVRSVRQDRTQRNWGFTCTCPHCSLPETVANASDHRLSVIYDTELSLADWTSEASIKEDEIMLLLSMYDQEDMLPSHAGNLYTLAALNYNALGREVKTREFALKCLEQNLLQSGPWSEDVKVCLALLSDPKGHWSWRKRDTQEDDQGGVMGFIQSLFGQGAQG
jgi:hypothetical protein